MVTTDLNLTSTALLVIDMQNALLKDATAVFVYRRLISNR